MHGFQMLRVPEICRGLQKNSLYPRSAIVLRSAMPVILPSSDVMNIAQPFLILRIHFRLVVEHVLVKIATIRLLSNPV